MDIPSGCRSSEPTPPPRARGRAPSKRGQGGHHDRPKSQERGLINGFYRILTLFTLGIEGKIDHHDPVLLHDADQQNNTDQGDDTEFRSEH